MNISLGRSLVAATMLLALPLSALAAPAAAAPHGTSGIIGGTLADISDVPWQVALIDDSYSLEDAPDLYSAQFCGGTVLNERWVITAAHCVYQENSRTKTMNPNDLAIVAGIDDLAVPRGNDEIYVSDIILAPGYDGGVNDIALIHLSSALDLSNPDIVPASLPLALDGDVVPVNGTDIVVSGWGEYVEYESGSYPQDLYKTTLDVLADSPDDDCGSYSSTDWNYRYEICIGVDGGGRDTCQGDSGGPYVSLGLDGDGDGLNEPTLLGVTSWGNGCASPGYPGFATRVSSYVDWIIPNALDVTTRYSARTQSHTVSWKPLTNQSSATPLRGYRVEYSLDEGDTWTLAKTTNSKTRSVTKRLAPDALWRVAGVSDVNKNLGPYLWADGSGPVQERGIDVTDAPTNFTVTETYFGGIDFEWDQPVELNGSAVWEYRIYRDRGSKKPQLVYDGTNGYATASVRTRIPGTNRYFPLSDYWVVAVNNNGVSDRSNVVSATSDN